MSGSYQGCFFIIAYIALAVLSAGGCSKNPAAYPAWGEQGPGPIASGQVEGIKGRPVAGAVKSIAPHPSLSNVMYIGTVSGGVWKTDNALDDTPFWRPLTDNMPSLSIGSIAFNPMDESGNSLFAGTGVFSSGRRGGPAIGIYRTDDGGETWTLIGNSDLAGKSIRDLIAAPKQGTGAVEPILLAATDQGLFRSTDGGSSFSIVLGGNITSLIADTVDPEICYAATPGQPGQQVFVSRDAGVTWTTLGMLPSVHGGQSIRLAMSKASASDGIPPLYVAIAADHYATVLRSVDRGDTWFLMPGPTTHEGAIAWVGGEHIGPFPGRQSRIHFSLAADPHDSRLVYLGGDRNVSFAVPSASGTKDFSGRLFIGDASKPISEMWQPLVGNFANGTSPHADSRDIAFDHLGNLIEADDGGLYRLRGPTAAGGRRWESMNGNLRITEFYSVAWDAHNDVIFGGTQDVGSVEQIVPNGQSHDSPWRDARLFSFFDLDFLTAEGDGGFVAVDNQSKSKASLRYTMGNNAMMFFRREYPHPSPDVIPAWLQFIEEGNVSGMPFNALHASDQNPEGFLLSPFKVSQVHPNRVAIGLNAVYESFDYGETVRQVILPRFGRRVDVLLYGGYDPITGPDPDILLIARGNYIQVREELGDGFSERFLIAGGFDNTSGSRVRDAIFDPRNWRTVFVLMRERVLRIDDIGQSSESVIDLTGNLVTISQEYRSMSDNQATLDLRAIEVFRSDDDLVLLVGGLGGVYQLRSADKATPSGLPIWTGFGRGLPNALVTDLHYNEADDILVAATWGRGAWTVSAVSDALLAPRCTPSVFIDLSCF